MTRAVLLLLLLPACSAAIDDAKWEAYKTAFDKRYADAGTERTAYINFLDNSQRIATHNAQSPLYLQALNKFSDGSRSEFVARFRRIRSASPLEAAAADCVEYDPPTDDDDANPPASVDWRAAGATSPVGDQAACGNCWAWATVGAIEGALKVQTGNLTALSVEDLSSCDQDGWNRGCGGGNDYKALPWVEANGISSAADVPFIDGAKGTNSPCNMTTRKPIVNITGCTKMFAGMAEKDDEKAIKVAVARQPLSASIQIVDDLMEYKSGIYTGKGDGPGTEGPCTNSTSARVSHGVLFVGYGTTSDGIDYWLMKNSWGKDWGEDGFFRILRGQNTCGVETFTTWVQGAHLI
eukprot:g1174.t1